MTHPTMCTQKYPIGPPMLPPYWLVCPNPSPPLTKRVSYTSSISSGTSSLPAHHKPTLFQIKNAPIYIVKVMREVRWVFADVLCYCIVDLVSEIQGLDIAPAGP